MLRALYPRLAGDQDFYASTVNVGRSEQPVPWDILTPRYLKGIGTCGYVGTLILREVR